MGLFSNKYKDCVKEYEQKFLAEAANYIQFGNVAGILSATAAIQRLDLETALLEMQCPDPGKYMQMFDTDIDKYINQYRNAGNKDKQTYDTYVSKMEKVVESSVSAIEKKRKIAILVEQARREIKDPSLLADLTISKVHDFEQQIDRLESERTDAYISGRLDYLQHNAPGARRASSVAQEEAEELARMMAELDGRKHGNGNYGRRY